MKHAPGWILALFFLLVHFAQAGEIEKFSLQPAGEGLLAPPGFQISLVASDPLVNNPAAMCVAPDGRIFICEDYMHANVPGKKRDVVKVLTGAQFGSVATEAITLAEDLNSVQGLAFHDGKLYIAHTPKISVLTVSADNKPGPLTDLFVGVGIGKGVKQSHTATSIIPHEGKLYLVHGDQGCDLTTKEGAHLALDCGAILRCDFDGSNLEVFAHGFRNIFGVAFDAEGNLFARDNTNDGGGYNVRNYHIVKGSYFGWPFRWREGDSATPPVDVLTKSHDMGGGSPTGCMYLSSALYPRPFNESILSCEWGRGAIVLGKPVPQGATFDLPEVNFITDPHEPGAKFSFRPTVITPAPDGSLLIADWGSGALYPTSAKGRVLRVKYIRPVPETTGDKPTVLTPETPTPELLALLSSKEAYLRARAALLLGERSCKDAAPTLVKLISDVDPVVRLRAATALGDLKDPANTTLLATALANEKERWVRHLIVRGLRISGDVAGISAAIQSAPPATQVDLLYALRENFDEKIVSVLLELSRNSKNTALRASATEFLGLVAKKEEKRWAWGDRPHPQPAERNVSWSATEAIMKQLYALMRDPEPAVHSAARVALQKLNDATLVESVLADLQSGKAQLDDNIAQILVRSTANERSEAVLAIYLQDPKANEATRLEIAHSFNVTKSPESLAALREVAFDKASGPALSAAAIEGLAHRKDKESAAKLLEVLKNGSAETQRAAARATGMIGGSGARQALIAAADSSDRLLKAQALIGLWRMRDMESNEACLQRLLQLTPADDVMQTEILDAAAGGVKDSVEPMLLLWLEHGGLGKAAEADAVERLKKWTKSDFGYSATDKAKRAAALKKFGEYCAQNYPKWKAPAAPKANVAVQTADDDDTRLEKLGVAAMSSAGDAVRGAAVFRNKRGANCIACHLINGEGARIGPELSEVGSKYARALLIESVLYPSKQLLDGYEQNLLTLKSGERVSGIVQNEDAAKLTVARSDGSIVTIPALDVSKRVKSKNSLMPDGLTQSMTQQDFFDLIAYLETLKKGAQ